jgi:hypothetical protein
MKFGKSWLILEKMRSGGHGLGTVVWAQFLNEKSDALVLQLFLS